MCIQSSPANFVSARLRNCCFTKSREKRTNDHNRPPQTTPFCSELIRPKILGINILSPKNIGVFRLSSHLHAEIFQKFDELIDIFDVRHIADFDLFFRQQYRREYLQRLILCSLRYDLTLQPMAADNLKCIHISASLNTFYRRCRVGFSFSSFYRLRRYYAGLTLPLPGYLEEAS